MPEISVCLVDDHQLFREGLKLLLGNIPDVVEVYEASDGQAFLDSLEQKVPDIVFMDIEMPVMNGIETTAKALDRFPDLRIVALSMYGDEEYTMKMIHAGVMGFILKNSGIQEVVNAIDNVIAGKNYYSQEIVSGMVQKLTKKRKVNAQGDLSERESEVLFYICKGYSNKEIADTLFISKRTVDKHRENLLLKTGSKNTAGLVMFAIQSGIIDL
ncbi:MAG: response regulator transcription factor [Bacteroidales bacterium]|nr:response regulator transcription factor [Bacteroidales bacterium]